MTERAELIPQGTNPLPVTDKAINTQEERVEGARAMAMGESAVAEEARQVHTKELASVKTIRDMCGRKVRDVSVLTNWVLLFATFAAIGTIGLIRLKGKALKRVFGATALLGILGMAVAAWELKDARLRLSEAKRELEQQEKVQQTAFQETMAQHGTSMETWDVQRDESDTLRRMRDVRTDQQFDLLHEQIESLLLS